MKIIYFTLGFLAEKEEEYSDCLHYVLTLKSQDLLKIQQNARSFAAQKFSEESFVKGFLNVFGEVCEIESNKRE